MASFAVAGAHAQTPPIVVSSNLPSELNPPFAAGPPSSGGAPAATPAQAAAFAWQEFIALNWPAGPQQGQNNQREAPSSSCKFGDPGSNCSLLVWETLRGKVEIFPGDGNPPPGYTGSTAATSWGYDQTPVYNYGAPIPACDTSQAGDATPWINLDETDEITLANMYAGNAATASSTGNSAPTLIRFLAKANRTQYVYVAGNSNPKNPLKQWWSAIPSDVVQATKNYLMQNQASPPPGSSTMVSQPYGTVEAKAGWRPLTDSEKASGRFHMQTVRFYEQGSGTPCYRDDVWGLVALHIIQKTPSAPYFIYATFEQADNILTADGKAVEDADGKIVLPQTTATTPQVCLNDPQPPSTPPPAQEITSQLGQVILTSDPASCQPLTTANYCGAPGKQLYYRNAAFPPTNNQPSAGNICVDQRDNAIPDYVITANAAAHSAITSYLNSNSIPSAPWLAYKLINVQYYPYDKIPNPNTPNASPYTAQPPFTATNPAPSSYYQANIVVETNRSLQLFAGGLSPNIATEWNADGTPHKNTYYGGGFHNMGGCMGCHGSQGQNPGGQAGDFSVILARGAVTLPEVPATESGPALSATHRNRKLSR
ncbi:MAG TPA: hypothetical protein VGC77_01040 [Rhodopseudomonas sp.]